MRDELARSNEPTATVLRLNSSAAANHRPHGATHRGQRPIRHLLPHNWTGTIALVSSGQAASILANLRSHLRRALVHHHHRKLGAPACRSGSGSASLSHRTCSPLWRRYCRPLVQPQIRRRSPLDAIAGAFVARARPASCWPACCTWLSVASAHRALEPLRAFHRNLADGARCPELVPRTRYGAHQHARSESFSTSAPAICRSPSYGSCVLYTMLGFVPVLCHGCDLRCAGLCVPRFRQASLCAGAWRFFRKRCEGPCAWTFDR